MYLITFGYDSAEFDDAADVRQFCKELDEAEESYTVYKLDYTYQDEDQDDEDE
jgi:hypothetical protein